MNLKQILSENNLSYKFFVKRKCGESLPINDYYFYHIETSALICKTNKLTGFYVMRAKLVVKRFKDLSLGQCFMFKHVAHPFSVSILN